MAFAFSEHGERSKLLAHIKSIEIKGPDGKPTADQSLLELAKANASKMIEDLPEDYAGARVLIEGRLQGHIRQLSIQVAGEKGHY